ncbi:MAG: hypothetical protein AB1483_13640 [Candidatus Zixiibacteriota bacterium]
MSEHLSTCSACRKEEAFYKSLLDVRSEIPQFKVSDDFNAKLLNRVAQERFAQTRTEAYLPKTAPRVTWGQLVPVVATACLVLFISIVAISPEIKQGVGLTSSSTRELDDSYLTVQPVNNPNLAVPMHRGWSLNDELARVERVNTLTSSMTSANSFEPVSGMRQVTSQTAYHAPYVPDYFRVRPVIRVYGLPAGSSVQEGAKVY